MKGIPHGGCNWKGCKECFPRNKKYTVNWRHRLGGANSEFTFAETVEQAIKNVMSKYDQCYSVTSVTVS